MCENRLAQDNKGEIYSYLLGCYRSVKQKLPVTREATKGK